MPACTRTREHWACHWKYTGMSWPTWQEACILQQLCTRVKILSNIPGWGPISPHCIGHALRTGVRSCKRRKGVLKGKMLKFKLEQTAVREMHYLKEKGTFCSIILIRFHRIKLSSSPFSEMNFKSLFAVIVNWKFSFWLFWFIFFLGLFHKHFLLTIISHCFHSSTQKGLCWT